MTPIFEGQPPQNKAFSNQNKGHLGSRYTHVRKSNNQAATDGTKLAGF